MSLRFALRSLVFQIIEVFGLPIGYNSEFQKFVNKRPRGLDALLGHLLDKRISVRYK